MCSLFLQPVREKRPVPVAHVLPQPVLMTNIIQYEKKCRATILSRPQTDTKCNFLTVRFMNSSESFALVCEKEYKPVTFSSNFVRKYLYSVTQNAQWLKGSRLSWLEAFGRVRLAVCPCFQFMPRQDKVNRAIKSPDVCGHITVALILIHFEGLMANQYISCKVKMSIE